MNTISFIRLLYLYLLVMVRNGVLVIPVANRYEYQIHFNVFYASFQRYCNWAEMIKRSLRTTSEMRMVWAAQQDRERGSG